MLLGSAFLVLGFACAVILALGEFGRVYETLDSLNFVKPYVAAVGFVAALVSFYRCGGMRRRRWRSGLAICSMGLCGLAYVEMAKRAVWDAPQAAQNCEPLLKVMEFNAWNANPDVAGAAAFILASKADIIVVEEALGHPPIAALVKSAYPYQQSCEGQGCSTMILSRQAPTASGGLAQGDSENRGALSAAWMRIATPNGPFTIVGVHLGRPWPWPRFRQDRALLRRYVASLDPGSTIVTGDFNLPSWTFQMHNLQAGLPSLRSVGVIRTWPGIVGSVTSTVPVVDLDHMYVGGQWRIMDARRGPFLGSDHYPIIANLQMCRSIRIM